jgi:5'-nucleotidase
MRVSTLFAAGALAMGSANALNILMNNDDGFGSANLREFYKVLKAKGHNGMLFRLVVDIRGSLYSY